jgi:hypothetical protein
VNGRYAAVFLCLVYQLFDMGLEKFSPHLR